MNTNITAMIRTIVLIIFLDTFTQKHNAFGQQQNTNYLYEAINLGDYLVTARAINNNGDIAGYRGFNTLHGFVYHAFLYSHGIATDIDTFGSMYSFDTAINNKAQIVGHYAPLEQMSQFQAFLYSNGSMIDLGDMSGRSSIANAINDNGDVVGNIMPQNGGETYDFLYTEGQIFALNDLLLEPNIGRLETAVGINNAGQITGEIVLTDNTTHTYIYSKGQLQILEDIGERWSTPFGINDAGQITEQIYTKNDKYLIAMTDLDGSIQQIPTGGVYPEPSGINNLGQVIGNITYEYQTDHKGFLYSQGVVQRLNESVIPESSVSFVYACAINDLGQIVGNGVDLKTDQPVAVLLNPLPTDAQKTIAITPPAKVHGIMPIKDPSKDNLVVVTHGWNPKEWPTIDISWVDRMCDAINDTGINNWQVYPYKWIPNSHTWDASTALNNAKEEGILLGTSIASQGWTHVHLIAHSAGAELIQMACERIKAISSNTVVQCTFLDPFVGFDLTKTTEYGKYADWAENYFCKDYTGVSTEQILTHAYNVDVTGLSQHIDLPIFMPSPASIEFCTVAPLPYHSEPADFYINTIVGVGKNPIVEYSDFGWPLCEETGGLDFARNYYTVGNKNPVVLSDSTPSCIDDLTQLATVSWNTAIDCIHLLSVKSITGTIENMINSLRLITGSPVWISATIVSPKPINIVAFDAQFTSTTNAAGLLTIYWDSTTIGSVDEKVIGQGWQHYSFAFPQAKASSIHSLGFRLDPSLGITSSVSISNLVTGQVGMSQPFSLSASTNTTNGNTIYELTGQAGFNYTIQASSDLINWTAIAILANTTGKVSFFDQTSTNYTHRFYRAVAGY